MAGAQRPGGGAITGINVTPLVDITLVLLIIFMVTAKLVVSRAIPVDLPSAATGGEVQQVLSVGLLPDGTTVVNGTAMATDEALLHRARETLRAHPELRAVLQADGAVPHRRVLHTLDVLRQAGVARVAFAVNPAPPIGTSPAVTEHAETPAPSAEPTR